MCVIFLSEVTSLTLPIAVTSSRFSHRALPLFQHRRLALYLYCVFAQQWGRWGAARCQGPQALLS